MTIVVDIDGVVCIDTRKHTDYEVREPLLKGIQMVQKLKRDGHTVILHTARWLEDYPVTYEWLIRHEVPFDKLVMGKPLGDVYIDDKALRWPCAPGYIWEALNKAP
jgi:uncharacterized HAD superfamily protein